MKHCLIMTAYKDVKSINHFIDHTPSDWGIYIHLDKKSSISIDEIRERAKVIKKYKIYWGGWEHLKAMMDMLTAASDDGNSYYYYHIVSGQDYFASSPRVFDSIVGENHNNYIGYHQFPGADWWWEGGYKIFKYRTLSSIGDIRFGIMRGANKLLYLFQKYSRTTKKLPKLNLFGGAVYCSLHKDFVCWLTHNAECLKELDNLKHTTCGEEVYFQTMIMNSPFKDSVINNCLRYVDWSVDPAPKYLNEEDYVKIINSKNLFCRKIDSKISGGLIKSLDKLFFNS